MEKKEDKESALRIHSGIDPPSSVDPHSASRFIRNRKAILPADEYVKAILGGNRTLLSRAITLVESQNVEHQKVAQEIIAGCIPFSGNSFRIGITGVPGVGKSSFIEATGSWLTSHGHKLAILAIDPSSRASKGSILGDKTRMERLSTDPHAFIRPSPAAGSLGGVARKTRESMLLCEAAGFDVIFIETVGVGQSETAVHSMVDFFLLLMLAGAGDELQGIKRGIMEMADAIAVTKADGDNLRAAELACREYSSALHLFPPQESGWSPRVMAISARQKTGLEELWALMMEYARLTRDNGYFTARRKDQARHWMFESIQEMLLNHFYLDPGRKSLILEMESKVTDGQLSSYQAAQMLMDRYLGIKNKKDG